MLRNQSTALNFGQAELPFGDQDHSALAGTSHCAAIGSPRVPPHIDIPRVRTEDEYQTYILKVKPLTTEAADRVQSLSDIVQQSFQQRRTESAGFILSKFSASLIDFWKKRCSQYSSTERFIRRVAKVFNLTEAQVRITQQYWGLPNCAKLSTRTLDNTRFATCLYLDPNETVRDPLENYYSRTITKASTLAAWDTYLNQHAFLSPDMLDPADIRYLLNKYPMPIERLAMLLQVHPSELADFAHDMNFPFTYHASAVPIRDLIGHLKHQRLTNIVFAAAHALYTYQAIPLRIIAERIGIDVSALFEQGGTVIGDWIHPRLSSVHHVIEITTLIHVEAGGVLRQNTN